MAAALDDYEERAKFERSANITPPPDGDTAKSAAARIEELKANREAAGLPVVRYPSTTFLMGEFGGIDSDGIWLYRLVSAFAHAKQVVVGGDGSDTSARITSRGWRRGRYGNGQ